MTEQSRVREFRMIASAIDIKETGLEINITVLVLLLLIGDRCMRENSLKEKSMVTAVGNKIKMEKETVILEIM